MNINRMAAITVATLGLAACGGVPSLKSELSKASQPVELQDSNYGKALACLAKYDGPLRQSEVYAAFGMKDTSGKANYGESGTGQFLTQGGEYYVVAALDKAGLRQRNAQIIGWNMAVTQHLPRAMQETALAKLLLPTKTLDGSTPGLGWVPGGGISVSVDLIEGGYRQYGIAVDKVMTLTDFATGQVIRTSKLRVVATAREVSAGTFRAFGRTIVGVDAGFVDRQLLPVIEEAMTDWLVYAVLRPDVTDPGAAECDKLVVAQVEGVKEKKVETSQAPQMEAIERRSVRG